MAEPSSFADCLQSLHDEFNAYDKTVDLVSCWQFYFTEVEPLLSSVLCFDRFPRLIPPVQAQETPKTPDFAVLLSESYGLVGEIKTAFPRDDENFLRHAKRLKKYDQPLAFKAGRGGERKVPTTHDILLLVPLRDAQETVARLEKKLREGALAFERSLVVFEWYYDGDRDEYVFRKVAPQSRDFQDSVLAPDIRLSTFFSQRAASLKIAPDKIKAIKASWQFCNDRPPGIFTLVFLWTKIFYHLLDSTQLQIWRRRDPQKQLPLGLTLDRLTAEIQRRYPLEWGHWTDWARAALDTLVPSGLVRKISDARYVVGFRNLTRELGEPGHPAVGRDRRSRPTDYARILATHICRGKTLSKPSTAQAQTRGDQGKLFPES